MSLTFSSPRHAPQTFSTLPEAILKTLAYSDVFDYPLTLDELHKYLVMSATKEEIKNCVEDINQINFCEGYYCLSGRAEIIKTRQVREQKSKPIFKRAMFYGKIIGKFPFVRMVALTGSLAMLNLSNEVDMDFMLITKPKRLWLARAFAVTFGRFMRLLGDRICINLLISENHLHWSQHDLYSAREICQMIPISGFDSLDRFRIANLWTKDFLPNANMDSTSLLVEQTSVLQKLFELPFRSKLGDKLEQWAMNFQMKIISRHENVGDETNFTTDICQGNFHQHKRWTMEMYEKKLKKLLHPPKTADDINNNFSPRTAKNAN